MNAISKPLLPTRVRQREERKALAEFNNPQGLMLRFVARHQVFIAILVNPVGGYTSCVLTAADAVKLELFIEEKTAPIISALQRTAKQGGAS